MVRPLCKRCAQEIHPDHLQFEGVTPVHKACWGQPPLARKLPEVDDLYPALPYMDRQEFVERTWLALALIALAAVLLL